MGVGVDREALKREVSKRFPAIKRWLRVERDGWVEDEFHWFCWAEERLTEVERGSGEAWAAGYEAWAAFWEWKLELRCAEMTVEEDPWRWFVEQWTDTMVYLCRRQAVYARGGDPGEWVEQRDRRPDLEEAKKARVAKIRAELDAERSEVPGRRLRRVG